MLTIVIKESISRTTIKVLFVECSMPSSITSILYVDNESILRDLTKEYLEKSGFIVDLSSSGLEALKKMKEQRYDAVVSDYIMPGMNGIDFLKQVRTTKPDIPFIFFTERGREEVVIEAFEVGADFYLQKGGNTSSLFTELIHKIRQAIDKRRTRDALIESEQRFRALIQNSSDIIRIIDTSGIIRYDSPSMSRILGYPPEFTIGKTPFEFIHPDDRLLVMHDLEEVVDRLNPGTPSEFRIQKASGDYIWVESVALNLVGVEGIDGIVTTTHPVQEKKVAEIALKENEERLRLTFDAIRDGFWDWNIQIDRMIYSPRYFSMLGYTENEFTEVHRIWEYLIHPDDYHKTAESLQQAIEQDILYDVEYRMKSAIGHWKWIQSRGKVVERSPEGVALRMVGVHTDITERKISEEELKKKNEDLEAAYEEIAASEEELRSNYNLLKEQEENLVASEDKYRMLVELAREGICHINNAGIICYVNPRMCEIFGYSSDEMEGRPLAGFMYSSEEVSECCPGIASGTIDKEIEFIFRRKDGSCIVTRLSTTSVLNQEGMPNGSIAVVTDITDLRQVEKERRDLFSQIQKNIAEFAVLNDGIRNPLTIIAAYSDMHLAHNVDIIHQEVNRINDMITHLDRRWIESLKILGYLRKYHGIDLT